MLRVINGELQWSTVVESTDKVANAQGSLRDKQENKGRYDLLPNSIFKRLALHAELGAKKYKERNWEKGQPLSQYYNSAMRHLLAIADADLSEDHYAAAIWNVAAMMHHVDMMLAGKLPIELDSFGVVQSIKEEIILNQLRDYYAPTNTEHREVTLTTPQYKPTWTPVIASGTLEPMIDYSSTPYKYSTVKAYDKDRFPQRRTVKLDPEELGD